MDADTRYDLTSAANLLQSHDTPLINALPIRDIPPEETGDHVVVVSTLKPLVWQDRMEQSLAELMFACKYLQECRLTDELLASESVRGASWLPDQPDQFEDADAVALLAQAGVGLARSAYHGWWFPNDDKTSLTLCVAVTQYLITPEAAL